VLVAAIAQIARPGISASRVPTCSCQSEVWALGLNAMYELERTGAFENRAGAWSFWKQGNPYGVRSRREQNA